MGDKPACLIRLLFGFAFDSETSCCLLTCPPTRLHQPAMASIALLLYLMIATSKIAGAVKVSPPSLHQEEGKLTEAELNVRSVSWFPAGCETFILCGKATLTERVLWHGNFHRKSFVARQLS